MIPRTCATAARLVLFLTGSLALSQQQPIDLMFALETSHGTEQAIGLLNQRALKPGDRAGVIGVNGRTTRVLQPLTDDREALATAIQRAGIRVGVALGGVQVDSSWTVDLATAIQRACDELKRNHLTEGRRAVVVLFGSEDPGLRTQLAMLKSILTGSETRLYAVVIDRSGSERAIPPGRVSPTLHPFPASTAQLMAELAEHSGGRIFRSSLGSEGNSKADSKTVSEHSQWLTNAVRYRLYCSYHLKGTAT